MFHLLKLPNEHSVHRRYGNLWMMTKNMKRCLNQPKVKPVLQHDLSLFNVKRV